MLLHQVLQMAVRAGKPELSALSSDHPDLIYIGSREGTFLGHIPSSITSATFLHLMMSYCDICHTAVIYVILHLMMSYCSCVYTHGHVSLNILTNDEQLEACNHWEYCHETPFARAGASMLCAEDMGTVQCPPAVSLPHAYVFVALLTQLMFFAALV